MKHNLLPILAVLTAIACSATTVPDDQNVNSALKVSLAQTSAVPDEQGLVSVDITLEGLPKAASFNIVQRSSDGEKSRRYGKAVLSEKFAFQYAVTPDDPSEIEFEFYLLGLNGVASKSEKLVIDNSAGFTSSPLTFSGFEVINRITGKEDNGHNGLPKVKYELHNNTDTRFDVGGTDLGITWEIAPGKYGMFFGDTFGKDFTPNLTNPAPGGSNWRGNVLLFSEDTNLSDGLYISGAATDYLGRAREICFSAHITDGTSDYTSIPTGAVHANGKEYVHYMNIKTWYGWVSNFSSYFTSSDGGETWSRVKSISFASRSNFGQVGMFNKDGYVYIVGTVTGRSSQPRLARVVEEKVEDQTEYEFWNGYGWVKGAEEGATPIFDDYSGELSFAWFPQHRKWILLYLNEQRNDQITMRYADNLIGPWSEPQVLTDGNSFWRPYGSFIHPLSLKGGDDLYFVMSAWNAYNTYLIHGKIK